MRLGLNMRGSGSLPVANMSGGRVVDPVVLFSNGELGGIYDPSVMSSLYQDAAGTQPVTAAGQKVAIMLDKRFGYRRDANIAPALSTATVGTGVTKVGSAIRFTAAAQGASADLTPTSAIDNAKFYEVEFTVSNYTAGSVRLEVFGTGQVAFVYPNAVSANGTYKAMIDLVAGGASNQVIKIVARTVGANTFDISDVTVKPVPGVHVWQTNTSLQPTLTQSGSLWYLQGNGTAGGMQNLDLPSGQLAYPLTLAVAAKADADAAGAMIAVWGGAPPYYEIQKSTTANRWSGFVRGAVNAQNNEAVGTNATAHTAICEITSSAVNLIMDGTDGAASTAQSNTFGTVTEMRVGQGGSGVFNGRFYGGIVIFRTLTTLEKDNIVRPWLRRKAGL